MNFQQLKIIRERPVRLQPDGSREYALYLAVRRQSPYLELEEELGIEILSAAVNAC